MIRRSARGTTRRAGAYVPGSGRSGRERSRRPRSGFAVATRRSDTASFAPVPSPTPMGTRSRSDRLAHAVRTTRRRACWRPALAPLFEVGFRITYIETYCAGGAGDLVDPRTYVSSGSDLF